MEWPPSTRPQSREASFPVQLYDNVDLHSGPFSTSWEFTDLVDDTAYESNHSGTPSVDSSHDLAKLVSVAADPTWPLPSPSDAESELFRLAAHRGEEIFSIASSNRRVRQVGSPLVSRRTRSISGQFMVPAVAADQASSRKSSFSTSPDVSDGVLRDLRALRKSRVRLSHHWVRYREQYKYVRQERNSVVSMIAVLEQELERNPPDSVSFDMSRIHDLVLNIRCGHSDCATSEARLDNMLDSVSEQERIVRSAEEKLSSRLGGDDMSDSLDIFEEMLGTARSLPASPGPSSGSRSAHVAVLVQEPSEYSTGNHQQEHSQLPRNSLSLEIPPLWSTNNNAPSSSSIDRKPQATTLTPVLPTVPQKAIVHRLGIAEQTGAGTIISQVGAQFPGDRDTVGALNVSEVSLQETALHTSKRVRDLGPEMVSLESSFKAGSKDTELEVSEGPLDSGPDMIARMFHVMRQSWLEFSTFVDVLEQGWGFIKTFDILEVDTLLRQIVWNGKLVHSPVMRPARKASQVSISTQQISQPLPRASVGQRPSSEQPIQYMISDDLQFVNRETDCQRRDSTLCDRTLQPQQDIMEAPLAPRVRARSLHGRSSSYTRRYRRHSAQ